MKNAVCVLLVLLTASPAGAKVFHVHPPDPSAAGIIIDHNCVDLSAIPQIHIAPASSLRLLLRHASVGQGIGWGLDCFAGLHPTNSECSCYLPGQYPRDNWLLELRAGNWKGKVDDLVTQAETRTDEFDVFTMKFCYIDALGDSHPDWDYYRAAMEQLELDYPDKVFVWWTIPLTRDGMPGTDFFNALVRSYCRANGKILFDVADIECHDPNGLKQTNAQGNEVICVHYTKEIHAGHLNVPGRIRVASALWQLMASIAGWHKGSIQAAIDGACNGDTIIVTPGTYTGAGNRDIDFLGKAITVRSQNGPDTSIIDCQGDWEDNHRGFYFHRGENVDSVVEGFTITNGYVWGEQYADGGGIYYGEGCSPTIKNNVIRNNCAVRGGGICSDCASSIIKNNVITNNEAHYGGGIACISSSSIAENNTISGNYAGHAGGIYYLDSQVFLKGNTIRGNYGDGGVGGVMFYYSSAVIINSLIVGNDPGDDVGGGIWSNNSALTITNCTIAGNYRDGINASGSITVTNCIVRGHQPISGGLTVRYSNVEGGYEGVGNVDADPCFANGDYHLKSQAGRWDTNEGRWTIDEVTSPCIDAGDPMSPIGREPFPNGGRINMGAYGGTAEASKSYFDKPPCEIIVAGDINGDCAVSFLDFRLMALHWLTNGNF